ncbi:MAG: transporter substrate-binding domain-containing protein [Christensenellaceae bacterium]|nr:transporter substrate-binding domain-containing protein [Christensenellaceae bacterium]
MKKLSIFLLIAALVLSLAACGGTSGAPSPSTSEPAPAETAEPAAPSEPAVEKDTFKVGMECAYPPYNWTQTDDSNGAVPLESGQYAGGYDVEIAKIIAEGLGKKLVIVPTAWDGLIPALQSGVIDAIIAGMSPTEERKESIDFTDSYYREDIVLGMVVKKGSAYEGATSLADFKGAKVTAQLGTYHYDKIDQIEGVDKQEAMKDFTAMRVALSSGIIDGYVSEKPEGESAMAADPDTYVFIEFAEGKGFDLTEGDTSIAVGIKKGNTELVEAINKILAGVSEADRKALMEAATKNQPAS